MNKSFFAGLVILAVAGCGGTTIGTATPAAVPAASTAASTAAAPVNEVQHIDVDKTYLVYMFGGESTATVDMTLDQVVVGASEIPAVQPHPGYVTYGFEFTVRGVSGSGKAWTQNFLAQNSSALTAPITWLHQISRHPRRSSSRVISITAPDQYRQAG